MEATRARWRFHHLGRRAALWRIGAGVMGVVQRLEPGRRPLCGLAWREKCQQQRVPRLGRHGVGGVGEESGVPLFLRVTRNLGPQMALHLSGGAVVGGKLRLEDASGNLIKQQSFKTAPLIGVSLVGLF